MDCNISIIASQNGWDYWSSLSIINQEGAIHSYCVSIPMIIMMDHREDGHNVAIGIMITWECTREMRKGLSDLSCPLPVWVEALIILIKLIV